MMSPSTMLSRSWRGGREWARSATAIAAALVVSCGIALAQSGDKAKAGLEVWKTSGCSDCHGAFANGEKERDEAPTGANLRTARLDAAALKKNY
jgi:cytochrome c553